MVQLDAEVMPGLLYHGHPNRAASLGNSRDDLRLHAGLQSQSLVRIPFKLLRPLPRRDEDCELTDVRSELGVEPEILAHLLHPAHELRTAEQWYEGAHQSSTRARNDFRRDLLLRVCQLVCRNRRHSILRCL